MHVHQFRIYSTTNNTYNASNLSKRNCQCWITWSIKSKHSRKHTLHEPKLNYGCSSNSKKEVYNYTHRILEFMVINIQRRNISRQWSQLISCSANHKRGKMLSWKNLKSFTGKLILFICYQLYISQLMYVHYQNRASNRKHIIILTWSVCRWHKQDILIILLALGPKEWARRK